MSDEIRVPKWVLGLAVTIVAGFGGWMTNISVKLSEVSRLTKQVEKNRGDIEMMRDEQARRAALIYQVSDLKSSIVEVKADLVKSRELLVQIQQDVAILKNKGGP